MKYFLKVAEDLYRIGLTYTGKRKEFYFRSAISRAYYGVLWYIRDLYKIKGNDLHGLARAVLGQKDEDLLELLNLLGRYRNYADYYENPPIPFTESYVKFYLSLAKRIIMRLPK